MKVVCIDTSNPTWEAKNNKTAYIGKVYTIRIEPSTGDLKYFGSYYLNELNDYYPATCFELLSEHRNKKLEQIGI